MRLETSNRRSLEWEGRDSMGSLLLTMLELMMLLLTTLALRGLFVGPLHPPHPLLIKTECTNITVFFFFFCFSNIF